MLRTNYHESLMWLKTERLLMLFPCPNMSVCICVHIAFAMIRTLAASCYRQALLIVAATAPKLADVPKVFWQWQRGEKNL